MLPTLNIKCRLLASAAATLTAISLSAPAAEPTSPAFAPDSFVIEGVSVLPMDEERLLRDQRVIIRAGRIAEIGDASSTSVPEDAVRIDGRGRYLMPGLAEMHAHIPSRSMGEDYLERVLFLYVAAGVTTTRGMLGEPYHLELRDRLQRHDILGPRLYTSGPSFNGRSVSSPEQAERMARQQQAAGYDFLKLHPGLELDEFLAIATTARELGIPFAGHVSQSVGLLRALEAGQATIDHLDGYLQALVPDLARGSNGFFGYGLLAEVDLDRIETVARATAAARVWNVPTQALIEHRMLPLETLLGFPELRYMPASTVARWENAQRDFTSGPGYDADQARRFVQIRRRLIKALHDAGAGLLLGSDAPQVFNVPGFSAQRELRILVESGLTPYEALRTATVSPARFFGASQRFGTVRPGLDADLLLLDANPLDDIDNVDRIDGVMVRGRWLEAAEIGERLEALAVSR